MATSKIALACDWYYPKVGGIEVQMRGLARQLVERGHEVHIITGWPGPATVDDVPVHRLTMPLWRRFGYLASDLVLGDLRRLFETEQFDLVHGHSIYSPLALGAMRMARQLGIPSVLTNHSLLVGWEVSLFGALDTAWSFGRDPEVIMAVSGAVKTATELALGRDDVRVVPNGIDPSTWAAAVRTAPARPRVTTVMRLTKRKRPMDLVNAVPRILAALHGVARPLFTIVGDGPEREPVARAIAHLGLHNDVELLGCLAPSEVRAVLANSTLFVLPTAKEAFSIAALEARCAGLPVVAMNHGGVGDVITHGVHGLLVNDEPELVRGIARLLSDAPLYESMSRAATLDLERYSWPRVVDSTLEAYRAAAERQRSRATVSYATPSVWATH